MDEKQEDARKFIYILISQGPYLWNINLSLHICKVITVTTKANKKENELVIKCFSGLDFYASSKKGTFFLFIKLFIFRLVLLLKEVF